MLQFEAGQLQKTLDQLHHNQFSGAAHIDVSIGHSEEVRSRVVFFQKGAITYVGKTLPTPPEFSTLIGEKLKLKVMKAAMQLANKKVEDAHSIQAYLAIYLRLGLFDWHALEKAMRSQVVLCLDQLWPHAGTLCLEETTDFDLAYGQDQHGFDWQQLCLSLAQRQQAWASLTPAIPSMDAIPHPQVPGDGQTVADEYAQQHLSVWIDGERSLLDIAEGLQRDPLELGHLYLHWQKMSWVTFSGDQPQYMGESPNTTALQRLPLILSVDDSLVVQTMLKRTLCDFYQVLTASNAVDALSLLNSQPVDLMLLDVTMPDIDGLEFCKTVRGISKFRDLPVVMLTAKDGLVNKVKGQMAGSTHYLTKPVRKDKLLNAIDKYLPSSKVSA
ncbi:response regulator [Acaryochloris sp. IP29b_bin.137]|uniref:response regulator n=1 Tax=Acaryochloris sp. IP29b_bin.137 TaxID=2969217 RepID=UPI002628B75C|nr:response regulator [Acaryochloris sp. IP29b_bin.137]